MKHTALFAAAFLAGCLAASAQLTIPSDGSDGAFAPAANIEIDLGLATTAIWDSPGSGNGVYDPDKWAVVFKYSSVNIPTGVKVTFKNHPTYAPVVWLVQGNVTIAGELNLDGKNGTVNATEALVPAEPGPGGYRGGGFVPSGAGHGYGPGGGGRNTSQNAVYSSQYGNPQIIPLLGGSGAGSPAGNRSGGGGGGALAIFCSNTVSIPGIISSLGGKQVVNANGDISNSFEIGSGGGIRVVADSVVGEGVIQAVNPGRNNAGRIRIETNSLSTALEIAPETIGVPPANPPIIWPAANAPVARVVSVNAVNAPLDPRAPLVAAADVALQNSASSDIFNETRNFPIEGVVQLFVTPKFGNRTTHTATHITGDINVATWRVQTVLPQGFVTLQARATQP